MADWKDILAGLDVEPGDDNNTESTPQNTGNVKKKVTIFYEVKGRSGKPATILADFAGMSDDEIDNLASELKKLLGTGGSCRGGEILIQGDRRDSVRKILKERGFTIKG